MRACDEFKEEFKNAKAIDQGPGPLFCHGAQHTAPRRQDSTLHKRCRARLFCVNRHLKVDLQSQPGAASSPDHRHPQPEGDPCAMATVKSFLNSPETLVVESLDGLLSAQQHLARLDGQPNVSASSQPPWPWRALRPTLRNWLQQLGLSTAGEGYCGRQAGPQQGCGDLRCAGRRCGVDVRGCGVYTPFAERSSCAPGLLA